MNTSSASGDWYYTHQQLSLLKDIHANGWKPQTNTGTKYGCGVYLARGLWYPEAPGALRCQLQTTSSEVMSDFPEIPGFAKHGAGRTQDHLSRYLKHEGVVQGRPSPTRGDSAPNLAIQKHFLGLGKKVVTFNEHDHEVCVVFDWSCIQVIELVELAPKTAEPESDLDDD